MRRATLFTFRIPRAVIIATHAPMNRTPLTTPKKELDTPSVIPFQILIIRIDAMMLEMMGAISQFKN